MTTTLPSNYDWRSSPIHLHLLGYFVRGNDADYVTGLHKWDYWGLNEKATQAVERFLAEGMLIQCDLEEKVDRISTAADLKKLLRAAGLKLSGSKAEMIQRLVESDRNSIEDLMSKREVLKTTDEGNRIIQEYLEAERRRLAQFKQKTFTCLQNHEFREACRAVVEHRVQLH